REARPGDEGARRLRRVFEARDGPARGVPRTRRQAAAGVREGFERLPGAPAVGRHGGQVIDPHSQPRPDLLGYLNELTPSDSLEPDRGRSVGSRIEGGFTHMMRKRKLRTAAKRRRKA